MTTQEQKALELALEALEEADKLCPVNSHAEIFVREAITAIKAALEAHKALMSVSDGAQPAVTESHKQSTTCVEPVALETIYETIIQWDEGGGKRSRRELARRIVSLYITPPQRKPLTFEQVEDCFPDGYSTEDNGILVSAQWLHDYARAVEAAHGIKEQ